MHDASGKKGPGYILEDSCRTLIPEAPIKMRSIALFLFLTLILSGCSIFSSPKTDISAYDRDYLENKYVDKTGWAKTDLGGIKAGEQLVITKIDFDVRTFVRIKTSSTDYFFIVYNNKEMQENADQARKVPYDIASIEREINERISFLKPN